MPDRPDVFSILAEEASPVADEALLAALTRADGPTAHAIVETLLVRGQPLGLRGLIMVLHQLDEPLRRTVLQNTDKVFGVLRNAFQSREEKARLNVIDVIHRTRLYRAAYLLEPALHDGSPQVREAAAEALHHLVDALLRRPPVAVPGGSQGAADPAELRRAMRELEIYQEDRRQLVGVVDSALTTFNLHLHPRVIEAAMWLVDDLGSKFWTLVSMPASRVAHAAVAVIQASRDPRLVPFAMMALNYGVFRPHVVRLLEESADAAFLNEWLRQSWRIIQPRIARGMAFIKSPISVRDGAVDVSTLDPDARRHVPAWLMTTQVADRVRLDLLRELERQGDRPVRRAVVRALVRVRDEHVTTVLRSIASGPDPEDALLARLELGRRRPTEYPPGQLLAGLTEVRPWTPPRAAPKEDVWGDAMTFDRYWLAFDRFSASERIEQGRELLQRVPMARELLADRLNSGDVDDRVRALQIVTAIDQVSDHAERIYQLSHDPEPEVRSAAMAALGRLPNPTTRLILRKALQDPDARVQANAIESIDRTLDEDSAMALLLPKLASTDGRVRANAVRSLLKLGFREAARTLLLMLRDENRSQRISALWLTEHMGLATLLGRIREMADGDDDEKVRDRARTILDRMAGDPAEIDEPTDAPAEVSL